MAALVAHGLFARHPNLRVATIESGSTWVPDLLKTFKKVYGQIPHMFAEDPAETFRRHVWVAPFFEDDIKGLAEHIGVDHILMGSDWPHAEGLPDPTDYIHDLKGFDESDVRLIMHDNARALATPRVPAAV
jgi:predicted TIM-barrel fold metal-dependent hydrolase